VFAPIWEDYRHLVEHRGMTAIKPWVVSVQN
jgi:hypothetical protein